MYLFDREGENSEANDYKLSLSLSKNILNKI